jgi:HEAT repeat protein
MFHGEESKILLRTARARWLFLVLALSCVGCSEQFSYSRESRTLDEWVFKLKDRDAEVRERAAGALKMIGRYASVEQAERVVTALAEALEDKEAGVRCGAARALGKIRWSDAEPTPLTLEFGLLDDGASDDGIADESGSGGELVTAVKAHPALIVALKDRDLYVRGFAALALGRIGRSAEPRAAGPGPIPALSEMLGDRDSWVRQSAAVALGNIGQSVGPVAISALIGALRDKHWRVRYDAAVALGKIGLNAALPDEPMSERCAVRVEGSIPALMRALKDNSEAVRQGAVLALVLIGERAESASLAALNSENRRVRDGAAEVLEMVQKK